MNWKWPTIALLLLVAGWPFFAPAGLAIGQRLFGHGNTASRRALQYDDERTWIVRQSFRHDLVPNSVRRAEASHGSRNPIQKPHLPSDLRQRLHAAGATAIAVERAADQPEMICCRCQVDVVGTPYLRRFECSDVSADLAGRRLLLEVQRWNAGRQHVVRARH